MGLFNWRRNKGAGPETKELAVVPSPGEQWIFTPSNLGPWPVKDATPVVILDVKDGWVRYDMLRVFRDERKTIECFTSMYRKVQRATES